MLCFMSSGIMSGVTFSSINAVTSMLVSRVDRIAADLLASRFLTTWTLPRQLVEAGGEVQVVEVPWRPGESSSSRRLPPIISGMWSRKRGSAIASSVR